MAAHRNYRDIAGILFFGTVWGLSEASLGDWMYTRDIPHAFVYLTAVACFIFALSKVFLPYRMTGTALGLVAMLFKLVNVPFFACHLLAIALLGVGFDMAYSLVNRLYGGRFRLPIIGLLGVYTGHALFAIVITYLVRYEYWAAVGLPKVIDYIFISGTVSALIGAVVFSLGTVCGLGIREFSWLKLHLRFTTVLLTVATLGIWILQQAM